MTKEWIDQPPPLPQEWQDIIQTACDRVLTEEEVERIGKWADSFEGDRAEEGPGARWHPLVNFIAQYTRRTRHQEHFAVNFRALNKRVMPQVIKLFEKVRTRP